MEDEELPVALPTLEKLQPISPRIGGEESAIFGMISVIDGINAVGMEMIAKLFQTIGQKGWMGFARWLEVRLCTDMNL